MVAEKQKGGILGTGLYEVKIRASGFPRPAIDRRLMMNCLCANTNFRTGMAVDLYCRNKSSIKRKKKKASWPSSRENNVCAAHLQQVYPSGHLAGPGHVCYIFQKTV